jgi:hypothetical protein
VFGILWPIIDSIPHWIAREASAIWHAMPHWPWATIAAFISAACAFGIFRSETIERQRVLGQENVADLTLTCMEWNSSAAALLGAVRRYLLGRGSALEINDERTHAFIEKSVVATRQFTSARLACNDFEMRLQIRYVERILTLFSALIPPSGPNETPAEQQQRLRRMLEEGLPLLRDFGLHAGAMYDRGFAVYSGRRSLRYRWKEWLFNRSDEAHEFPALPPTLPLTDPGLPPEDDSDDSGRPEESRGGPKNKSDAS